MLAIGCAAGCALGFLVSRRVGRSLSSGSGKDDIVQDRSTTSSDPKGGGIAAYETSKAVDEYLQFHFGDPKDILPYSCGPQDALGFPARCAALVERHCDALLDIEGQGPEATAIDMGCAVGGAAFELARSFKHVLGVDYSHKFIEAAQKMADLGSVPYRAVLEADITESCLAWVHDDIERDRVRFMQGDACALPDELQPVDALLAANLLCRLPQPLAFLSRLPSLIKPGGVAVLVSPYSWLSAWTPRDQWLGGYVKDGQPVRTADAVAAFMQGHGFELVLQSDMPFLIREHQRKYQWGCSHATVWKRKVDVSG